MIARVWGVKAPSIDGVSLVMVDLPRGEYQRNRQLACWSEGFCPSCLSLLDVVARFCLRCRTYWHCQRDPMPARERARVRGRTAEF